MEAAAEAEALSPFLEGTQIQIAWDSTSLGWLKVCPQLYKYQMIDGWVPPEESVHLRFGQEYHQALQNYDVLVAQGCGHDAALHEVVRELLERTADYNPDPETRAGKYKSREALVRTVIWYLDEHRDDPARVLIMADGRPAVELSFQFELDWGPFGYESPYTLCGHLDKIVDYNGSLFIMDHKTTTTTPGSYYFDQFEPNNQMTLYTLASQIIVNSPVKGVIINVAQLLTESSRFVRGITYRTPDQTDEWTRDLEFWLSIAQGYAEQNYWPKNDTACDKYGGCRFREVCSKSPKVREQFLKSHFTQLALADRWNPLKPR